MSCRTETVVGTGFTLVMLCNQFFVSCQCLYSCHDNMCTWCKSESCYHDNMLSAVCNVVMVISFV